MTTRTRRAGTTAWELADSEASPRLMNATVVSEHGKSKLVETPTTEA